MVDPNTPFKQLIRDFKTDLESQGRASATILAYTKDVEQLADFVEKLGKLSPQTIDQADIDNYKTFCEGKNFTPKSISRKINSIKSFFRYLEAKNIVGQNPAAQVSHPRYDIKPPRILSKLEYRALRDTCRDNARMAAIVELLLQTGMRISEVANLDTTDLNTADNKINVKAYESHESRTVPLNDAAKQALQNYLSERPKTMSTKLFVTKTGNPFLVRNIRSSIDRFFRMAGIEDAKVNDLRHTFIAHQLMSGAPLVYISKLAGHKRLSTTEKYLEFIQNKTNHDRPKLENL